MPDTLKQFYNASINVTGLTGNQTATLFTNNSTTRAVIKDVDVSNTFPVQPNLTVGGTPVAALVGSLTGSEIADTSQVVGISFPSALEYSRLDLQYLTATAGNTTRTTSTSYRINSVGVSSVVAAAENASSRTNSYHGYYYVAADNDVFFHQHDGSTIFILSKRAGGPTGTASNIVSSAYPIAFDGRYYYYLTSTTNLRRFDPETETTTDTSISSVAPPGAGARLVASVNGYLLYVTSDGGLPYIIKISNGYWSYQGSWLAGIYTGNSRSWPGFFIDPTTLVATVVYVDGTSQTIKQTSSGAVGSFTSPSQTSTVTSTALTRASAGFTQYATVSLTSSTSGYIFNTAGNTCLLDVSSGTATNWTATPITSITDVNFFFSATAPTPTVNATNFPSTISLRITGVEVTP